MKDPKRGRISFFFVIIYLICEYMRPQQMYSSLSGIPLAKIAIACIVIASLLEGLRFNNFNFENVLLLLFLSLIFLSCVFAVNQELAWPVFFDFVKWAVIYFLLINVINTKEKLYGVVVAYLLLHFKQVQYLVRGLVLSGFSIGKTGLYAGAGFFANPGDLGTALIMVLGISYYMMKLDTGKLFNLVKMKWVFMAITVCTPVALLATNSRGPSLAFVFCLLGIWIKGKRKFAGIFVAVAAVAVFIVLMPNWDRFQQTGTGQDKTGQERLQLWAAGLQMAQDHMLTGVGPDNFVYVNQEYYGSELDLVQHNTFIQALSELGYTGLFLFVMMIIGCFRNQRMVRRILKEKGTGNEFLIELSHGLDIGLIGFIVASFFVSVLYYPFFWIFLVISVTLIRLAKEASLSQESNAEAAQTGSIKELDGVGVFQTDSVAENRGIYQAWKR